MAARGATARFFSDRAFWVLLGVAGAVRLLVVVWLWDTAPYSDYFYYHEAGRLQSLDWAFFFHRSTVSSYAKLNWWPPGYPVFLGVLYSIAGPNPRVAALVQVVLGVVTCGLVAATGARAAGRRVGLAAGWLLALDPTYVFTTNLVASENLFAPLVALAVWQATRRLQDDPRVPVSRRAAARRVAPIGISLGLATLVRATGLVLPLVFAAWCRRRSAPAHGRNIAAATIIAAFAATLAPWTLRNLVVAGSPALVCFGGGLNFYFGHNDGPLGYRELSATPLAGLHDAAAIDQRGYALAWDFIRSDPAGVVTRGVQKIGALFAPPAYALHANTAVSVPGSRGESALPNASARDERKTKEFLLHGPLTFLAALHAYLLLAAAILAVARGARRVPEMQLALAMVLAWTAVHVVFWAQPRFRYPIDIPMALLAASALRSRHD